MEDKKEKSIVMEAFIQLKEIEKAAEIVATNKLVEKYQNDFKNLLNEELKSKNKKAKESDKTDKAEDGDESENGEAKIKDKNVMKNQEKEVKKTSKKSVEEPVMEKDKKMKTALKEEFGVGNDEDVNFNALDEFLSLDEIEREISDMEKPVEPEMDINDEPNPEPNPEPEMGDDVENVDGIEEPESTDEELREKLISLRQELDDAIALIDGDSTGEEDVAGLEDSDLDGLDLPDDIDNEEIPNGEENVEPNFDDDDEIEEAHGLSYSARRNNTGRHLPDAAHLSKGELDQAPNFMQESKKKLNSLISENKNLTQKVNAFKEKGKEINEYVTRSKDVINKYRTQLSEMAIFSTNLAHVNNILVNESLALTQEEKIRVISEFKSVKTIAESQNKYKSILTEMKSTKKPIQESILPNDVVGASSKNKLDEVVEKIAYKNDAHMSKILRTIQYVERKNKR